MANHEIENDAWVDGQLKTFVQQEDGWQPSETRGLNILREKQQAGPHRWWISIPLAATLAGAMFVIPATRACAQSPLVCMQQLWIGENSFKELGSKSAPATLEIYLDYECPPCAAFFTNVLPAIEAQYVETGKLRLTFRDLPVARHSHARLAARYANAAGRLGYYQIAAKQIFATQSIWSKTGNVESQLALVLSPAILQKVRDLVLNDPQLEERLDADIKVAAENHVNHTPGLVLAIGDKREALPADNTLALIGSFLDSRTK
jgi:Thioredoxin